MNTGDLAIDRACRDYAEKPALLSTDGQLISFARLGELINSFATRLNDSGVQADDFVAIVVDNQAVRIGLFFALSRIGANAVMSSKVSAVQTAGVPVDYAIVLQDQMATTCQNIVFDQTWLEPTSAIAPFVSGALMVSGSSGTSGLPKYMPMPVDMQMERVERFNLMEGECCGPQFHGYGEFSSIGYRFILRALISGNGCMYRYASPAETLERMVEFGVKEISATPILISQFVDAIDAGAPVPNVERVRVGGGPASKELLQRVADRFACPVGVFLGSTETSSIAGGDFDPETYEVGCCGPIVQGMECRLEDDHGIEVVLGETGKVALRIAPEARCGDYYNADGPFDADGWFRSGDLAYFSPRKELVIVGRITDLINTGGSKMMPSTVEFFAGQAAGVLAVTALGVRNALGFEDIGLVIVRDDNFSEANLRTIMSERLGEMLTIHVRIVDQLSYSENGKLDRRAMVSLFQ